MSNTELERLVAGEPEKVQDEIVRTRDRALQLALLIADSRWFRRAVELVPHDASSRPPAINLR